MPKCLRLLMKRAAPVGNFLLEKRSFNRKGLEASIKLKEDTETYKSVIEDELSVQLTPSSTKSSKFLCNICSWNVVSMATSRQTKTSALKRLKESGGQTGYLSSKIRSPFASPRKKWAKLSSPGRDEVN
ncbi:hypothetical protein SNE40_013048 [Patella caerulea]|uniref:Uncharacterized protein n=1 Tax=Patella caerulea TaxID=87958 RepID=A0AAN8JK55_PATCE